jgi:hypothetical protein
MKTMLDLNTKKVPAVRIDPSLDKYDNIVLFPDKLQEANKRINQSTFPFPKSKNPRQ